MSECPIPCNLCGGSDVDVIGRRARDGRPLRTTICRNCGLVWSNPRPEPAEVRRYYSNEYRLHYKGRATPSLRHVARSARGALNRFRELEPFLRPGARVLDAGAGGGEVVYVLRRFGYDASGLEPDAAYASHAREALGVPVQTGFIQDVDYGRERFDAITMYHALEHVEDPLAILTRLREWLPAGGVLLVEVPNIEARSIAPSHRFHFAHFYGFNRQTLESLGGRAGFERLRSATSPDGGNLTVVFRAGRATARPPADAGNYERLSRLFEKQTLLGYFCTPYPYAGPLGRLRTYLVDSRASRGCGTPREVLENVIKRSRVQP